MSATIKWANIYAQNLGWNPPIATNSKSVIPQWHHTIKPRNRATICAHNDTQNCLGSRFYQHRGCSHDLQPRSYRLLTTLSFAASFAILKLCVHIRISLSVAQSHRGTLGHRTNEILIRPVCRGIPFGTPRLGSSCTGVALSPYDEPHPYIYRHYLDL